MATHGGPGKGHRFTTGVQVLVDVPLFHLDRPFTYRVPAALLDDVHLGSRVKVPFGGRRRVDGWVVGRAAELAPHYVQMFRSALRSGSFQGRGGLPALDLNSLEALFAGLNSSDDNEVVSALDLLQAEVPFLDYRYDNDPFPSDKDHEEPK